ncbi:MAG: hypothetical protein NZ959_10900 [Armatimonadetes bacterium]|nr:hypothetical protein [Armatimonadota bacterium]MDW8122839.1 DUF6785 family protein [Armatimonadota bacterium]
MAIPAERLGPQEEVILAPSEAERPFLWSWRAFFLLLLLLPVNIYWIGVTEGLWHALHMTTLSLPMNVLVLILALSVVNDQIRRCWSSYALTPSEMGLLYIGLTVQSVYIGHDMMVNLFGVIPAPSWFENPSNRWREIFFPYLPDFLVITNKEAVMPFYLGGRSFYGSELVPYWIRPSIYWTILLTALFGVYLSVVGVFFHRWSAEERLQFPILRLPMQIISHQGFYSGSKFWTGFSVAGAIELLNHFNFLYPWIPSLKTRARDRDLLTYLMDPPWNAIGSTPLALYPFIIGYAYLMPLDLCISTWLFYLLRKVERLIGVWRGWTGLPRFPYENEQSAGAALSLALLSLHLSRFYLKSVISGQDRHPYPISKGMLTFLFFLGLLICFSLTVKAGLGWGLTALFWIIHLLISLTVGRIRAEAGPPSHSLLFANPQDLLVATAGSRSFHPRQLTVLALYFWFNRLNRNHPLPVIAEGWKVCQLTSLSFSRSAGMMVLMAVLSIAGCFAIYPVLFYREGAATRIGEVVWVGADTYNRLASWISGLTPPDIWARFFVAIGGGVALFLFWGYQRTSWWILHPLGYLLGTSFAVDYYWLCLVIGSLVKAMILRYWGARAVVNTEPFFVGLVIGDGLISCLWSVYGLIVHRPMYDAWW